MFLKMFSIDLALNNETLSSANDIANNLLGKNSFLEFLSLYK